MKNKSILQKLLNDLENRPWYEKLWSSIKMFNLICQFTARHWFLCTPKNKEGSNFTTKEIKDDIEFGYDLEMIYNKIMNGCYNNDMIDEKNDWFKKHNIDWKEWQRKVSE